ncbi:unnamed protein product [Oppiella nova]|uniref:Ig-like domain-containing protein n=1 Tax=Oppiella nova TaxID=334625 RepID=A0A7R9LB52_9ACAR|nr:unnamed protein product [Oppiella nova]CAG2160427.1 unnamed protein product [Oppiella nova]
MCVDLNTEYSVTQIFILFCEMNGVTVTEVHIISINTGRSDYVIQGESAQLSCHYILTKQEERVQSVRWEKDGQDVYFSTPNKKRPIAVGVLKGHVDYNSKDLLNTVVILNVTLDMHGTYSCHVDSDINTSQNSATLTVIIAVTSTPISIHRKTRLHLLSLSVSVSGVQTQPLHPCRSPPTPLIYTSADDFTDKYFAGEAFDVNQELPNGTYEISIRRRYHVTDFIN